MSTKVKCARIKSRAHFLFEIFSLSSQKINTDLRFVNAKKTAEFYPTIFPTIYSVAIKNTQKYTIYCLLCNKSCIMAGARYFGDTKALSLDNSRPYLDTLFSCSSHEHPIPRGPSPFAPSPKKGIPDGMPFFGWGEVIRTPE